MSTTNEYGWPEPTYDHNGKEVKKRVRKERVPTAKQKVTLQLFMTPQQHAAFRSLGGVAWARRALTQLLDAHE